MNNIKVFSFKGRLNRKPYIIFSIALTILTFFVFLLFEEAKEKFIIMKESDFIGKLSENDGNIFLLLFLLMIVLIILVFIGDITLAVRRLHDLNLSGWWYLPIAILNISSDSVILNLIEFVFYIFLIFKRGTVGENKYGADPLSNEGGIT